MPLRKTYMQVPPSEHANRTDTMDETADRTAAINLGEAEGKISKNAQKKAGKQAKLAEEKANKSATTFSKSVTDTTKEAGRGEAKKATNKHIPKTKKIEGAALIGIDVAKEDDFSGWYQQVLTKGDFLDYYDVSGCYILKVWSTQSVLENR